MSEPRTSQSPKPSPLHQLLTAAMSALTPAQRRLAMKSERHVVAPRERREVQAGACRGQKARALSLAEAVGELYSQWESEDYDRRGRRWLRTLSYKVRAEFAERFDPAKLAERLQKFHGRFRTDPIPATWCQSQAGRVGPASVVYERRWNERTGWQRRHNCGSQYDCLVVQSPAGVKPVVSADGREITIGAWTWRKLAGHTLAVRYAPQGREADRAAFKAEANQSRRQAIVQALGDEIRDLLGATIVQADDYGTLFDCVGMMTERDQRTWQWEITNGQAWHRVSPPRMLRVVCPTTGRAYWLGTRREVTTAKQAVAASFGLREVEYSPAVEV